MSVPIDFSRGPIGPGHKVLLDETTWGYGTVEDRRGTKLGKKCLFSRIERPFWKSCTEEGSEGGRGGEGGEGRGGEEIDMCIDV